MDMRNIDDDDDDDDDDGYGCMSWMTGTCSGTWWLFSFVFFFCCVLCFCSSSST
jgi:hypothetical protein